LGKNGLEPANRYMQMIWNRRSDLTKAYNSSVLNDLKVNLNFFSNYPTLFWFFNWSQNIDILLETTALIGKLGTKFETKMKN
jgi:hypothetical protein